MGYSPWSYSMLYTTERRSRHRIGNKQSLCVRLFAIPWTAACPAPRPWDFPGKNTGVGSHPLLQEIFPTQRWNLGLLLCRWILYHLSCQGRLLRLLLTAHLLHVGCFCYSAPADKGQILLSQAKFLFSFPRKKDKLFRDEMGNLLCELKIAFIS